MSKEEYWAYIALLKSQATQLVPEPKDVEDPIFKTIVMRESLDLAVSLFESGMSKKKAARTAHVGDLRLNRRLQELGMVKKNG